MGKIYNIAILTQVTTTVTNQSSDCLCFFDWSLLPMSRWRCRLVGAIGAVAYTTNMICQVFIDLGIQNNEMGRNSVGAYTGTSRYNSQYVGTMMETNQGTACAFYCPATKNPPFYLPSTPRTSPFKLNLVNNGSGQSLFAPNTATCLFVFSMEMLDDPVPRTIKGAYNLVFNSANGDIPTSINSVNYQFDWSRLPRGKYQVNTTMMTSLDASNGILYAPVSVYCDLGQGNKTVYFASNQNSTFPSKSNFVALLFATGNSINGSGATGALYSYRDQNAPIYLENRPANNNVTIELRNAYDKQYTQNYPASFNYTIVFHFQWLGE